jgi:hypothetical protein
VITTALELPFADGNYLFDLKLPQAAELQEKRGAIFALYGRVMKGRYLAGDTILADTTTAESFDQDLYETIRLGLIGGGRGMVAGEEVEVTPMTARTLVERYCHSRPLRESWAIAASILMAKIEGYEPKKDEPAAAPATEKKPRARKRSTSS